jgi:type IV pilus assembly protein PilA
MQMNYLELKQNTVIKNTARDITENYNENLEENSGGFKMEAKSSEFKQFIRNVLTKNQKGLTLIELLAVIVILGIIAAIAVPSISAIIKNSERSAQKANAHEIINAAKLAISSKGYSNTGIDNTAVKIHAHVTPVFTGHAITDARELTLQSLIDDGFIKGIKDPYTKSPYSPTTTEVYVVRSSVTDATTGTTSDIFEYFVSVNIAAGTTPVVAAATYYDTVAEKYVDDASKTTEGVSIN